MRISDWSSDVCSSDLVDILALGRAAPFADPGRQHFRARQILVAILVEEFVDIVGTPEIALEAFGRAHQLADAAAVREDHHPDIDRREQKADHHRLHDDVRLDEQRDGRSEEHTSELQSLMRIAYAVFCLKKKKSKASLHTK